MDPVQAAQRLKRQRRIAGGIAAKCIFWLALALSVFSNAYGACNNPANWLQPPTTGVKVFVGDERELPFGFATRFTGALREFKGPNFDNPYPPPLPAEMLDKPWHGTLGSSDENHVSYYEPDGKGQWRICRLETWPINDGLLSERLTRITLFNHAKNPPLLPYLKTHYLLSVTVFLYDKKGRIAERFVAMPPLESGNIDNVGYLRQCFRFDDKDRPALYVETSDAGEPCPKGDPDPRFSSLRFKYMDLKDGRIVDTWAEIHFEGSEKHPTWVKEITFRAPFDMNNPDERRWFQGGNARVDEVKGLTEILGGYNLGAKDQSIGPTFKYESGNEPPSEYYFRKPPVPMTVLTNPETIYQYDRLRKTDVTSVVKLVERFPANVTRLRERYFVFGPYVVRHEQLDANGRLKRAINVGAHSRQDSPGGFYDEDMKSVKLPWKLKGHDIVYRVWDYDDAGKGKLVAIGWNAEFSLFGKTKDIEHAKIIFGTPDGLERWPTKAEFAKAFDFDEEAKRAYR